MQERLHIKEGFSVKMSHSEDIIENRDGFIKGLVSAVLKDENGAIKEEFSVIPNLIVTNGRNGIADRLLDAPTFTVPTHMGVGTGAVAPVIGDTTITAIGTRVALSSKTRLNNVVTMVATFAAGNATGAITEAGIFNHATAGVMFSRITFAVINKGASDTLELTWTYTIG